MSLDPDRHRLSEAVHSQIFQQDIAPLLFRNATAQERPVAIILGGQPGAGKSATIDHAVAEFGQRGGLVQILGDDLRTFHPRYTRLQREDDQTAAFYTDRDSGRWVENAIAEAANRRCNVMIEGTMRVPDKVAETLERFRAAGYETDARALAVHPDLSRLGILQRYVGQKESRGYGRMTTQEAHAAALSGMLDTLDRIQDGRLANRLSIYRRGNEQLHSYDLTAAKSPDEPRARGIVEAERSRPFTLEEATYLRSEMQRLAPILDRIAPQRSPEPVQPDRER